MRDLRLGNMRDGNIDNIIAALIGKVVNRLLTDVPHLRISLIPPILVDSHDLLRARGGWFRECEPTLDRALRIRLGHEAIRNRQVGNGPRHGARDAHGVVHEHGAVVRGLEAVDAVEGGGDANAAAGVGADAEWDDAGG